MLRIKCVALQPRAAVFGHVEWLRRLCGVLIAVLVAGRPVGVKIALALRAVFVALTGFVLGIRLRLFVAVVDVDDLKNDAQRLV